jgi:Tfp pilus assembly protein PilV
MRGFSLYTQNHQNGMTLLEVMVGFVIFSASLVAILDYVSNQIYLNHLTEKNQHKVRLIYDYSLTQEMGVDAQQSFASTLTDFNLSFDSTVIDSFESRRGNMVLTKTIISVEDGGSSYDWSIYEIN